jgi:hypothetical protein
MVHLTFFAPSGSFSLAWCVAHVVQNEAHDLSGHGAFALKAKVLKVGLQVGGYPEVHKSFHNWFLVDLHTLYLGTIRTQIFLYWISFYV